MGKKRGHSYYSYKRRKSVRWMVGRRKIKGHHKIRVSCVTCGRAHTRSAHRSHGHGSYRRTH